MNLLKKWHARDALCITWNRPQQGPPSVKVAMGEDLSPTQRQELRELVQRNMAVFSEVPGRTDLVEHQIHTLPVEKVCKRPYRIPEAQRVTVQREMTTMLEMGVLEESHSEWSSPIVLVPKPDRTVRFCNDFRGLNEVNKFDAFPMPWVGELIDRLRMARYISTLDLTKGYAGSGPGSSGLHHYRVLPFGLHGAPATVQRLMDCIMTAYLGCTVTAYLG